MNRKESSQDRFLREIDKLNRHGKKAEEKSLQDQIKEADEYSKLLPSEKLKRMEKVPWERHIEQELYGKISSSRLRSIMAQNKEKFASFHENGSSIAEIWKWLSDIPDMPSWMR